MVPLPGQARGADVDGATANNFCKNFSNEQAVIILQSFTRNENFYFFPITIKKVIIAISNVNNINKATIEKIIINNEKVTLSMIEKNVKFDFSKVYDESFKCLKKKKDYEKSINDNIVFYIIECSISIVQMGTK